MLMENMEIGFDQKTTHEYKFLNYFAKTSAIANFFTSVDIESGICVQTVSSLTNCNCVFNTKILKSKRENWVYNFHRCYLVNSQLRCSNSSMKRRDLMTLETRKGSLFM